MNVRQMFAICCVAFVVGASADMGTGRRLLQSPNTEGVVATDFQGVPSTLTVSAANPLVNAITITPVIPYPQNKYFCNVTGDSRLSSNVFPLTVRVPVGVNAVVVFANITGPIPGFNCTMNGNPTSVVQQQAMTNPTSVVQQQASTTVVQQQMATSVNQQMTTSATMSCVPSAPGTTVVQQQGGTAVVQQTPTTIVQQQTPTTVVQQTTPTTVVQQPSTPAATTKAPSPPTTVVQQPSTPTPTTAATPAATPAPTTPKATAAATPAPTTPKATTAPSPPTTVVQQPTTTPSPPTTVVQQQSPPTTVVQQQSPPSTVVQQGSGRHLLQEAGRHLLQAGTIEYISNNGSSGQPQLTVLSTTEGVPNISFKPTAAGQTAQFLGALQVAVTTTNNGFGSPYIPYQVDSKLSPQCQVQVNFVSF